MKLAHNINTAYLSRKKELADCKPSGIEYEERVIKSVIDKTEADPMFEELLDDLLGRSSWNKFNNSYFVAL